MPVELKPAFLTHVVLGALDRAVYLVCEARGGASLRFSKWDVQGWSRTIRGPLSFSGSGRSGRFGSGSLLSNEGSGARFCLERRFVVA